jgi:hypothetical protein
MSALTIVHAMLTMVYNLYIARVSEVANEEPGLGWAVVCGDLGVGRVG